MASPDHSGHSMVALYPPLDVAKELAVADGLAPEKLHVTVAYCGLADDVDAEALREAAAALSERQPITASVSGHARFTGDEQDVIVAIIDAPELDDLRRDALQVLQERGIDPPRSHGYVAHMTLQYVDRDAPSPVERLEVDTIEFTTLASKHGKDRTDFTLEHPIAAPAREAFAAGWALSGGPMTERVKAASTAAVRMAIECADDPRILEVTIDLGRLEGMWALLYQRRDDHLRRHVRLVKDAWRALISRETVAAAVDTFRRSVGLTEAERDDDQVRTAAHAAAAAMLAALPYTSGWTTLRTALRDALRDGQAEGMVNAVAVAAERADRAGLDWNTAFDGAYQAVRRLDEASDHVGVWLTRLVQRAEAALARVLQRSAEAGDDRDTMTDAAMDAVAPGDSDGTDDDVDFVTDWALTSAAALGAMALYQSEGAMTADWISVGDGRVCAQCEANEAGNPWALGDLPEWPAHPRCRCFVSASVDLSHFDSWFA